MSDCSPVVKAAEEKLESYVFSDQVGYLLRRAYQRHLAIFQANSGDPQLTAVQFSTLCSLRDCGPQSQVELVKSTAVDQTTIRGIVDRLTARKLVVLSRDPCDGRKVMVAITKAGRTLLDDIVPRAQMITELTMEPLNSAEQLALLYTLRLIVADPAR